jgi:hypothetical protein
MENSIDREFRGMRLKTMKRLFNYEITYKTAKTPKLLNALTSLNTWIWRLKFGLGA